jgi:flagellar biogenesis protein FliO
LNALRIDSMELMRQIAAVTAVLLLLYATTRWLRRRGIASVAGIKAGGKRLQSLDRLRLGPQHTLHLVKLGNTALLVSSSPTGCALLDSRPCNELQARETAQ